MLALQLQRQRNWRGKTEIRDRGQKIKRTDGSVAPAVRHILVPTANPSQRCGFRNRQCPSWPWLTSPPQLLSALDQLVPNLALQLAMAKTNGRRITSMEMPANSHVARFSRSVVRLLTHSAGGGTRRRSHQKNPERRREGKQGSVPACSPWSFCLSQTCSVTNSWLQCNQPGNLTGVASVAIWPPLSPSTRKPLQFHQRRARIVDLPSAYTTRSSRLLDCRGR